MTKHRIEEIVGSASEVRAAASSVFNNLRNLRASDGTAFDFGLPACESQWTLSEIEDRMLAGSGLIESLQDSVELLVPDNYIDKLKSSVNDLKERIRQFEEACNKLDEAGLKSIDSAALVVTAADESKTEVKPLVNTLVSGLDEMLARYYPVMVATGQGAQVQFSHAHDQLRDAIDRLSRKQGELEGAQRAVLQEQDKVAKLHSEAETHQIEIERLRQESESARKSLLEHSAEGETKIAEIRNRAKEAESLKQTVEGYKATFDSFQQQLEQRRKTFEEGKKEQDSLLKELGQQIKELEVQKEEVKRLTNQADEMLKGATTAGLASEFERMRRNLTEETTSARKAFYLSVVVLFVSVLPLVAFLIEPWIPMLKLVEKETVSQQFADVLLRILVLIPGVWFAKFTAARHAALFKLREDYAYKYSIAASVEGFKRQAETHKEEIAALAFSELTFNPADKMDSKGGAEKHPNPLMNKIYEKLGISDKGG